MQRSTMRRLISALCTSSMLGISEQAMASAFQIWEQDGASVGNYHAGYAAEADDASTSFYNPAGITRIKNQQVVGSAAAITPSIKYEGTVAINTLSYNGVSGAPQPATAQGGKFGLVPAFHYVAPLNEYMGFGFSVTVPFGADVDYGHNTPLRYVTTDNLAKVLDYSPALGFKVTDKASLGLGFDVQQMWVEFDQVGTYSNATLDSEGIAQADDTAYGYHLGALYEFTPNTRAGISYHSKVRHHLSGTSTFTGPLADPDLFGPIDSSHSLVNMTVPAYTAFSIYHRLQSPIALKASAIYTQWSVIDYIVLQDVAGIDNSSEGPVGSTSIDVTIPQHFTNTWNVSVGADYFVTEKIILRSGLGFDQSPVPEAYRTASLPDNDRYVIALGGHYQATQALGFDLAWNHMFIKDANINPPTQVTGVQETTTDGTVSSEADVISAQVTWTIV